MKLRLLTLAAAAALAAPTVRADHHQPPVEVQTQSLGKLLDDIRGVAKLLGNEQGAEKFNKDLKDALGEKGFAGIDLNRPLAGYLYLPEENSQDFAKYKGAVVVPITGEDEFKDFVARLGKKPELKVAPVDGKPGLYKIDSEKDPSKVPVRVRFKDGHAYVGVNTPDDEMAADRLPAAGSLVRPTETAQVAVRALMDRYPAKLKANATAQMDETFKKLKEQAGGTLGAAEQVVMGFMGYGKRVTEQMMNETEEAGYRLIVNSTNGDAVLEAYMTPRKGSQLAKDFAARKPTQNQFNGVVTGDTAAAVKLQLPLFAEEIRTAVADLLALGKTAAAGSAPPPLTPLANELFDGLTRTVKTGSFDAAVAVNGPDKDGHFTAVGAVAFDDAPKLEAAIKEAAKNLPQEAQGMIKFDAAKAGGVNVHAVSPPNVPENVSKVFGATTVHLAFAKNGIYFSVGTGGVDALKAALAAPGGEAKAFDVAVNPSRLAKLIAVNEPQAEAKIAEVLGKDDKLKSAFFLTVDGGEALKIRFGLNLAILPRGGATAAAPAAVKD